jgi:MinD superfamily P-loop ATPase
VRIVIASGKGGTGKTFLAVNLVHTAAARGEAVTYVDCDVEEPNGHIFLRPTFDETFTAVSPVPKVDPDLCTGCGECGQACERNAIVVLAGTAMPFPELCNGCGFCRLICPEDAIVETTKEIGIIQEGWSGKIHVLMGKLRVGEAISPPLIRQVQHRLDHEGLVVIDSPPGTSCPVIQSVRGADYVVLVTEPTPFSLHDLRLAVGMVRELGLSFGVVINRQGVGPGDELEGWLAEEGIPVLGRIPDDRRVAEIYSRGGIVGAELEGFEERFAELWDTIGLAAGKEAK